MVVRNADGTTRIVNETTTQQIASKPAEGTNTPQKIQVMRGPDGKMSVRGLQANQKLVQTAEGKYLILPANQTGKLMISSGCALSSLFSSPVVSGKVVQQGIRVPVSSSISSPVQQPPQKVLIRSVPKTIISANNVVKIDSRVSR